MVRNLLHILEDNGFDKRAAQLYVAGLQLGSAPASDYAKAARVNRITAYNSLEDLVRRGLFTKVRKAHAKWYSPVAPEHLAVEARKNADALERSLPELRALQGQKFRKPRVRFFDGFDGMRRVYEDTLTAQSEILNFANSAVVRKHWPEYEKEYVAKRVEKGISLRGIAPNDAAGRKVQGKDKETLREIRLVPAKDFDFTNEINIYDHKVAIISFGIDNTSVFGVVVESKEVAETQRQIFEMSWRYAGK